MSALNRSGTRRTGDDYQDVVAIDLLIGWLGSNDEYEWFKVEADDALHLDDVTAKRADGTLVYRQVKYSTAPQDKDDPWVWEKLLDRGKPKGSARSSSLLEKWAKSVRVLSTRAASIDAAVISNRRPGPDLRACLAPDGRIDPHRIPPDLKARIAEHLGETPIDEFFAFFRFELEFHGLKELEEGCRRRLGSLGGIEQSWFGLKEAVSRWVCFKDEPRPGGKIFLEDLHRAVGWHGLRTIPQNFEVPADFVLSSHRFLCEVLSRLKEPTRQCLVLTGPPGSGKSTFTSYLFRELRAAGKAAVRHHYYLPSASDYTAYQRADHILAAESLMHDLKADYSAALGAAAQRNPIPSPNELRAWLVEIGKHYQARGERMVLMLDGLDHVWRERRDVEQLAKLLGPLLPPPEGVVLLLVTQPVSDERLPPQVVPLAPRSGWVKLQLFDRHAVRRWTRRALAINGLLGQFRGGRDRARQLSELADHLWEHSGGHPLHLRYTLGALLDRGLPLVPSSLARLPGCPSEDIAMYYATLWHELGPVERDLLLLVAACGFPWPARGLTECATNLGHRLFDCERAFQEIRHLLSESNQASRPFHASLLVFLREQDGYREQKQRFVTAGLRWLKEAAPESWRWAYTWQLEADLGDPSPLIAGLDRPWLVRAVAEFRPAAIVKSLISRGLWHAADLGNFDALARISLLADYSISSFEYYEDLVSSLLHPLLLLDQAGSLLGQLRPDVESLHHEAILVLAEHGARVRDWEVVKRCFAELRERATDENYTRNRMSTDRSAIIRATWSVAALGGSVEARGMLGMAARQRGRGRAGEVLAIAATELRKLDDVRRLRELLGLAIEAEEIDGPLFSFGDLAPLAREASLHAIERGLSLPHNVESLADHPLVQIHGKLRSTGSHSSPDVRFPEPLETRSLEIGYSERIDRQVEFFRDAFYALLANHLLGRGESNHVWIDQRWIAPWVERFLPLLDDATREFAASLSSGQAVSHRWLFEFLQQIPRPEFRGNANVDEVRVAASAAHAMTLLGLDLTLVQQATDAPVLIIDEDIDVLRHSEYCLFEEWLKTYAELGRPLMEVSALAKLLRGEEDELAGKITHMNDRARRFTALASVAAVHQSKGDVSRLVTRAAECIVAHGNHKDMLIYDALLAVSSLCKHLKGPDRPGHVRIRTWLDALAGPIAYIGDYTDGDETGHLLHDFSAVLADNAPEVLPRYYKWLSDREEYDEAISAFAQFLRISDLTSAPSIAVARTAVERKATAVLADRDAAGDAGARMCLKAIHAVLGSPSAPQLDEDDRESRSTTQREPSQLPSPEDFPPPRFDEYLVALRDHFSERDQAINAWAEQWERAGEEEAVLKAFEDAMSSGHWIASFAAPYRISSNLGDRDQAFLWLVRAHRENSGWYWMNGSEEDAEKRWGEVRAHFSSRWIHFLRDTIRSSRDPLDEAEPWRGASIGHGAFPRLVRYCLALGRNAPAITLVDAIVRYSVEYVSPVPLPVLPWVGLGLERNEDELALDILITRLTWPSGLVRERVSDAIGSLLDEPDHADEVLSRLLEWMRINDLESTSALAILPFFRRAAKNDDTSLRATIAANLSRPSILSDVILHELVPTAEFACSRLVHSGDPPPDFQPEKFFVKHAKAFVPQLYWIRAGRVEELGARDFRKQWAYEWMVLVSETRAVQSTSVLNYLFASSSYKEPHRAADPRMAEVFRSAYLRALAWAVDRGRMPLEDAAFLAGDACPVDAELWKLRPGRRPGWWPRIEPNDGPIDTTVSKVLAFVEAIRTSEATRVAAWGTGWTLAQAAGRVSSGEAVYDVEIVAFLQRSSGPRIPSGEAIATRLLDIPHEHGTESPIAFRGVIPAVEADDTAESFDDWIILPLAAAALPRYPVRWQWWRLDRPIWLPFIYKGPANAHFGVEDNALCVRLRDEVVAKWSDWTDGVEEVLNRDLPPPAGSTLLIKASVIEGLAAEARATLAWAVRVTCLHRESRYKDFETHNHYALLGGRTIITAG